MQRAAAAGHVTTVPGTVDFRGSRTVACSHVKDDGIREVRTLDVSGDRNRVKALLESVTGERNIHFDEHYDKM